MKWAPAWGGFYIEKDDTREKSALGASVGDVVFFDNGSAVGNVGANARPIAIRRKGSERVENLNVGHAARWQQMQNDAKAHAGTKTGQKTAAEDYEASLRKRHEAQFMTHPENLSASGLDVSSAVWGAIPPGTLVVVGIDPALKPDQHAIAVRVRDEIISVCGGEPLPELEPEPFPVSSDPSVYDAAMGALVGKVRERQPVDIVLPIDDSDRMELASGYRTSDGYHQPPPVPLRRYPRRARRAPFGIDTMAPQSGFCSSGVIYGAMPDE